MSQSGNPKKRARIDSSSIISADEGINSCRLRTRPAASLDTFGPAIRQSPSKNIHKDGDSGLKSSSPPQVPGLKRGADLISSADPPQLSSNSFIFTDSNSTGSAAKRHRRPSRNNGLNGDPIIFTASNSPGLAAKRTRTSYRKNGPNGDPLRPRSCRMPGSLGRDDGRSRSGPDSEATWSLPSSRDSSFAADSLPGHRLSLSPPNRTQPLLVDAMDGIGSPRLSGQTASADTWSLHSSRASSYAPNSIPGHRLSVSPPPITQPLFAAAVPRHGCPRIAQCSAAPSSPTSGHHNVGGGRDTDHQFVYLGRTTLHYRASMARRDSGSLSPSPDRGEHGNSSGTPIRNAPRESLTPAGSCFSDNTARALFLETLTRISLLPQPVSYNWNHAYAFLLSPECSLNDMRLHQVRTLDYVPQANHKGLRTCYHAILHVMHKLEDVTAPEIIDGMAEGDEADTRIVKPYLLSLLRRWLLAIPALILPYDSGLGKHSKQEAIKKRCQTFMDGGWDLLYAQACKAFSLQRPRPQPDAADGDRLQQRKHKKTLILSKKGNMSKAYKQLTQEGLVDHDASDHLRSQHKRDCMPILNLHLPLVKHIQQTTNWQELLAPDKIYKQFRKQKNGKAPDRHGMRPEISKVLIDAPEIMDLYIDLVFQPIAQGTLSHDEQHSSIGAQMYAARKSDPLAARPVTNPDTDRCIAAAVLCNAVFKSREVLDYFENSNPRWSQRGISKDGCLWKAKEIQREIEAHDLLAQQPAIDLNSYAIIDVDIKEAFPSIHKQALFDALAGTASKDYPSANIQKGDLIHTPDIMKLCLPLAVLLYSQTIQMEHYFAGRTVEIIDVDDGLSQGSPEGTPFAVTAVHFCVDAALAKHTSPLMRVIGIADDLTIMGPLNIIAPFFLDLKEILKDVLQANVNPTKTCLIMLQIHDLPHPNTAMAALLQQLPSLAALPIRTAGAVFVGYPIGHPEFIADFLADALARSEAEFEHLLAFPYAHVYLQLLRWCCCPKISHLTRGLSPKLMMDTAKLFDKAIDKNFAAYFKLKFESNRSIADINPQVPLGYADLVALSKYQFREPEGLNFPSVAETAIPAYFAATLSHLAKIAPQIKPPASLFVANESAGCFSEPFQEAYQALLDRGATPARCDPKGRNGQLPNQRTQEVFDPKAPFLIPHIDLVGQLNPILIDKTLVNTIRKATNQAQLATWFKYSNDDVARVSAIRTTNPSLNARAQHLATTVTTGPHGRFDIPPAINITHNPTAFLTSILPYGSDGMSSYQLSLYLILILGLPMPPMLTRDGTCPCGAPHSIFGYHQLNCKHWAGKSWHKGHDLCVKALAYETRRLGLGAVDSDHIMKTDYAHSTSQKRGDIAVTADGHFEITNVVDHLPRSDVVIDVKICATVNGAVDWKAKLNANNTKLLNPTLTPSESAKYTNHERNYASVGNGHGLCPICAGMFW